MARPATWSGRSYRLASHPVSLHGKALAGLQCARSTGAPRISKRESAKSATFVFTATSFLVNRYIAIFAYMCQVLLEPWTTPLRKLYI